ncbi:methyltransferase [Kitasatospora aureofaciens]|uniref:methyltransferase n=1 Tax=Kitasatospora aureofaciens TaxID=1894 RepID=UPI0027E0C18D|nr:methyltransferase [Kitasatospora aureofaciens]
MTSDCALDHNRTSGTVQLATPPARTDPGVPPGPAAARELPGCGEAVERRDARPLPQLPSAATAVRHRRTRTVSATCHRAEEVNGAMETSLVSLVMGSMTSATVGAAAHLGVADALADGPATAAELAAAVDADPDALVSLMTALTALGVFARDEEGRYTNSPQSEQLRTDHPESIRHLTVLLCGLYAQAAAGGLTQAVRTGTSVMPNAFGVSLYEYLEKDPETARIFDLAMQDWARPIGAVLAEHVPFENVRTVIDVGGGNGALLKAILTAHPHLKGICVDRPDTCRRAEADLRASGNEDLIERLTYRPADILREVPGGGELYILKNVLHDWSSESGVQILSNIRRAMSAATAPDGAPTLLVIDPLAEHDSGAAFRNVIKMVVGETDARERTEADMRREAAAAGLQVLSITPCPADLSVTACIVADSGQPA